MKSCVATRSKISYDENFSFHHEIFYRASKVQLLCGDRMEIIMNELLGERIRMLRIAKSFTQEQLADYLGISRQKYARIEKGVNSITLDFLSKIASLLEVTVGDITKVLDETPVIEYRKVDQTCSPDKIFEMLDLFYANKQLYNRLQNR